MERITLQEYYDGIWKIREEYYSEGKEAWARKEYGNPNIDYSEERLDIEVEVFQGRLEILEDFINDSNRLAERYSNVGKQYCQAA